MELYWIKSKSIDDIEEKNLRTLRLWWAISFSLFTFFSGRESERKLAVQLAPSSELPSDSSWTSGRPDTLTHGHLDDLAPDKKVQPPHHSPSDFFWQIALLQVAIELLLNYLSVSEYFTPVNATTQYW